MNLKSVLNRVCSLVPAATEPLFALGVGDLIVGFTCHDTYPKEVCVKAIVGGFFDPCPDLIDKLKTDMIPLSQYQSKIRQNFADSGVTLIQTDAHTIEDGLRMIELIGKISGKNAEAAAKSQIQKQFHLASRKVSKIPEDKPKRVIRLMAPDTVVAHAKPDVICPVLQCRLSGFARATTVGFFWVAGDPPSLRATQSRRIFVQGTSPATFRTHETFGQNFWRALYSKFAGTGISHGRTRISDIHSRETRQRSVNCGAHHHRFFGKGGEADALDELPTSRIVA